MKNNFHFVRVRFLLSFIVLLWSGVLNAQVAIPKGITFQDAVWNNRYGNKEDVSGDAGGYIGFAVRNLNAVVQDAIIKVQFSQDGQVYEPEAQFWWPLTMQPDMFNYSYVYAKGLNNPFREDREITIDVWTENGHHVTTTITNITPKLKIGNVLQVADQRELFRVYLRNDDTQSYSVDSVDINGRTVLPGQVIAPGHVGIFTIDMDTVFTECAPLYITVKATPEFGSSTYSSAGIRVVEPEFPYGTWHSSSLNPDQVGARKRYKELGISSIHGPSNEALLQKGYNEFGLRGMYEPEAEFSSLPDTAAAAAKVRAWAGKKFIHLWNIDDEPDLNGKDIKEQILKNLTYWINDPNIPSYVNLAVMKKYNRYGWYADVVGMDHYAAPPAPNIIALTWVPVVGRAGELEEALDYTEYLKFNTEPRRMWTWCQLAPGPWSYEQDDFALNIQFWMHVMGGTKGMEWFVAQAHTKSTYPQLWTAAAKVVRQLNSIKYLAFYGERTTLVTPNSNKVLARALVGPYSVVIPVVNNTTKYNWNGSFSPIKYNATIQSTAYTLDVELPEWIDPVQAYRVADDGGKLPVNLQSLGGNKYRIIPSEQIFKEGHVYVIASADTEAPLAPTGLNVADSVSGTQYTLSWNEPFDNFGVKGYYVFYNDRLIDSTAITLYEVNGDLFRCPLGEWRVRAYDASGNTGPAQTIPVAFDGTTLFMSVAQAPEEVNELNAGQDTSFYYLVEGLQPTFSWQYSPDGEFWTSVPDNEIFSGNTTARMSIAATPDSLDGYFFRTMVTDICNNVLVTEPFQLLVSKVSAIYDKQTLTFQLYPNPAGKFIHIDLPGLQPGAGMEIIDFTGKVLMNTTFRHSIDISALPAGAYQLRVRNGDKTGVKGFVKE